MMLLLHQRVLLHQITFFDLLVNRSSQRGSPGLYELRTRLSVRLPELEQAAFYSARCELSNANIIISWVICNTMPEEQAAAVIPKLNTMCEGIRLYPPVPRCKCWRVRD